jgi:uroporphyrinogen decarboxylase
MNSREIVKRTLEFNCPARVAHSFEPSDFVIAILKIPSPQGEWHKNHNDQWERVDEWGNVWGRADETSKGQVVKGVLDDWRAVKTFPMPDFSDPALYDTARATFAAHPDKWRVGGIHGLTFSVARKIRRLEQYLEDLLVAPEVIRILHDRVDEQIRAQILRFSEVGADSIMFWEDWGTQQQTLISPRLWRQEFKPRFVELVAYAHALNLSVIMHSCGKIAAIVPDLIECGIDVFQFDQPRIHGIDVLQAYQDRHRVTFWCPVDIQTTLQTQDESLIRQEADELLAKLWRGKGGFIAGYYRDNASIGLDPQWQAIASDEFLKKGQRLLAQLSGWL